ncbi:MAG: SDR family NAD(P)-dependent oxidoreductase [Methylobacteriaceae bacterium]|jgi:NAD(P)-dependent dehydrogenase (short-subunit alcohol dehydrogenase family)|nr:SDR family NAD(P)-dependent oxidoreductase [Methylobacteriaceae bacterium]
MEQPVALVTGASSGFGREIVLELIDKGYIVCGAARRVEKMADLEGIGVRVLALDITDDASVQTCVAEVLRREGRIDVLVNNAGYGAFGAVEEVLPAEARRQFDVNVFGLARLTQLVIPAMRSQRSGVIVNITSVAGRICPPFGAWYAAAKHAVEALSDGLRYELKPFGIHVVVIEPGMFKTGWDAIALASLRKTSGSGPYAADANRVAEGMAVYYDSPLLSHPRAVARVVGHAVTAANPKTRYVVGRGAGLLLFAKALLPDKAYDFLARLVMR